MARSRFDELHDAFLELASKKAGFRYEVLAGVVFVKLQGEGAVIHDLKVRGTSGIKHQIDILVEIAGARKRILIECKDLDLSGRKVNLDIVKQFFAVMEDVRPDEAWVVTCNGFTGPAKRYADAKSMKTAILREASEEEKGPGIAVVGGNFNLEAVEIEDVSLGLGTEENLRKWSSILERLGVRPGRGASWRDLPTRVQADGVSVNLDDYARELIRRDAKSDPGAYRIVDLSPNVFLLAPDEEPIPLQGCAIRYHLVLMAPAPFRVRVREVPMLVFEKPAAENVQLTDVDLENVVRDPKSGRIQ